MIYGTERMLKDFEVTFSHRFLFAALLIVVLLDSEYLLYTPHLLTSDIHQSLPMCVPSSIKTPINASQFAHPNVTDCLEASSISWDFIDKIIYINARHSTDRNEAMVRDFLPVFQKSNEDIIRYEAYTDSKLTHAQCVSRSHVGALQIALERGFRNVLILEDDVLWRVGPNHKNLFILQDLILSKPYDVIIFGGTFVHQDDDHRARHSYAASSYLVNGDYIRTLLGNFQEGLLKLNMEPDVKMYAVDVWWNRLMKYDLWYVVTPALVIQSSYPVEFGYRRDGIDS